jgi:hypothetical protein
MKASKIDGIVGLPENQQAWLLYALMAHDREGRPHVAPETSGRACLARHRPYNAAQSWEDHRNLNPILRQMLELEASMVQGFFAAIHSGRYVLKGRRWIGPDPRTSRRRSRRYRSER